MGKHKARTTTVVDNKVQGALSRRVIIHLFSFIAVGSLIGMTLQFLSDPFQSFNGHLAEFWRTLGPYLVTFIVLLPVFIYNTNKLTNRIAGPVHRLRMTMQAIRSGEEPGEMKFREGDYWREMADEFNEMVAELRRSEDILAADESATDAEASQVVGQEMAV